MVKSYVSPMYRAPKVSDLMEADLAEDLGSKTIDSIQKYANDFFSDKFPQTALQAEKEGIRSVLRAKNNGEELVERVNSVFTQIIALRYPDSTQFV